MRATSGCLKSFSVSRGLNLFLFSRPVDAADGGKNEY